MDCAQDSWGPPSCCVTGAGCPASLGLAPSRQSQGEVRPPGGELASAKRSACGWDCGAEPPYCPLGRERQGWRMSGGSTEPGEWHQASQVSAPDLASFLHLLLVPPPLVSAGRREMGRQPGGSISAATWHPLRVHVNLRTDFSISAENGTGVLIGTAMNLWVALGVCRPDISKSSDPRALMCSHSFVSLILSTKTWRFHHASLSSPWVS